MISLGNARMKSRDAKRVADVKQVQVALEMFYDTYGPTYGALYNWYVVDVGNLCPFGWRVPIDNDFKILVEG